MVQLDVDSEVNHVVGPLNPKPVDHREPVFVGGVPGKCCLKRKSFQSKKLSSHNCYCKIEPCVFMMHLVTQRILYTVSFKWKKHNKGTCKN